MPDTALDTLVKKDKSGNVISGGRLVAKALKAEGVDTIFTLCGGHIIDIYDVVGSGRAVVVYYGGVVLYLYLVVSFG